MNTNEDDPPLSTAIVNSTNDNNSDNNTMAVVPESIRPSKSPIEYSAIRIDDRIWSERLQDEGCRKEDLVKASYRQNKIPPFGPSENQTYYPLLSSIAIDFLKSLVSERKAGRGWSRLPKNNTDIKTKIIERLMMLRKIDESSNKYELNQSYFLSLLETSWGMDIQADRITDNDKLRLFGLLFLSKNEEKLHRLAEGISSRQQLDDPSSNIKYIFQNLALDFNNSDIIVELPEKSLDIPEIELDELNGNDESRIRIQRDSEKYVLSFLLS